MNKNIKNFIKSAEECAKYIMDSDCEQQSYQEYLQSGENPRDHILFHAGVVLGLEKEFQTDIDKYLKEKNV